MSRNQYSYLNKKDSGLHHYDATDRVERSDAKTALKMNYDDILEELGELGPWQILHVLLLWLPPMAGGIIVLTYSFTGTYQYKSLPKSFD